MIGAILLAAGSSARFGGEHKLLAPIPHGEGHAPLIRVTAERLLDAGCIAELVVVLGRDAESVRNALADLAAPIRFVHNVAYLTGMASSLREGVRELSRSEDELAAAFIALGDQPAIRADVVRTVVATFDHLPASGRAGSIVVPRYRGVPGHPVLFGRAVLPELLQLTGDRGGRAVVERDTRRVHFVDCEDDAPADIDSRADWNAFVARGMSRDDAV